jgi:hypothetical protein
MNRDAPDSLDGRYFGPLPLSTVVGRAVPVWTFEVAAALPEPQLARAPPLRRPQ